ncbi:gamma-glutamyl-gamma-aminobutyrate hydrolase family protein [Mycolicibacterium austroafricanum]|uniref:gamma-glutamyl-gamma-aminobutyrate hydrolase family protein n=1 Tax=Mycolicibacterium austroafricanum TaxID=39687 RepID=UPI001CA384F6|nr:gamma-glutamyl-gamma-aminobutyrate hydrolase family protein [Mycolicibacterium austroafricanum]QZT60674.1 gamma-glutamyl-gamma-aminobutyrate hydrolase family protein [Mycolicibacterium austroafricanum]
MTAKPLIAVTLNARELDWMLHWRKMFEGLQTVGAIPMAIECGSTVLDIGDTVRRLDGLVISGGGDVDPTRWGGDPGDPTLAGVNPVRDHNEIAAFEAAWNLGIPTLAICRGAQLVTAARGGALYADLPRDFPTSVRHRLGEEALVESAHDVELVPGSRVAEWSQAGSRMPVNSQHHQGVRTLAAGFTAVAHAPDGLVEAFESPERPFTAVQWHPEVNWATCRYSHGILDGFVQSCRARMAAVDAA